MRYFTGVIIACAALCVNFVSLDAWAESLKANSDVKDVTVYQNRAMITRTASVEVPKGAHEIVISKLSPTLDPNTIRVAGKADANVMIGTVNHNLINTPELTDERAKELNGKIQVLQDRLSLVQAEKQALNVQQKFLQNLGNHAQEQSNENITQLDLNVDQWGGAAQAIGQGMEAVLKQRVQLDITMRGINDEIAALQAEMNKLRGARKNFYEVSIAVEGTQDTTLDLELSYQIHNASWSPVYDARLSVNDDGKSELEIVQFGNVTQNTGEDWSNVKLTLSTAQPHRSTTLAELRPNWINIYPEGQRIMRNQVMSRSGIADFAAEGMAMDEVAQLSAAPSRAKAEAVHMDAVAESNGFAVEYVLAGLVDVPSDGSASKLRIAVADVSHEMQTHIRPQLSQNAFWVAKMTLQGDAPLLAGQASLYRDDAYIGKGYIPFLMPNKEHHMSFGINDLITVETKTLKEEEKEAGMVLSSNEFNRHMITEIENIGKEPYAILVQKRIPSSQNEELEVEIVRDQTTSGYVMDWNNVKGVLSWEAEIAPSKTKNYELGYELSWPKGYNLSGQY